MHVVARRSEATACGSRSLSRTCSSCRDPFESSQPRLRRVRVLCTMATTYRPIAPIATQRDLYAQPVTALAFDAVSDTLWTGNNVGSIVAFYGTQGHRGVSFPVGGDLPVKEILSGDKYVRALGTAGRGVGQWSKGGINQWYHRQVLNVS